MKDPVAVVGVGEMGGVFARGLLRAGYPVIPVTRGMEMAAVAENFPTLALVLVAVAEKDLHAVLARLPEQWRGRLALLQNELLPRDWEAHGLADPTVISVWFEKKAGREPKVIIPSPAFGPAAGVLVEALAAAAIPARELASADQLLFELVVKNLYILTANLCGLQVGGTVAALWADHRELAAAVAGEVLAIQEWLTGRRFEREEVIAAMVAAFDGDPEHQCLGRTAPARLARALEQADAAGLAVPVLRGLPRGA